MKTTAKRWRRRRLPEWLAGGPLVSGLAYRIVADVFGDPPHPPEVPEHVFEGALTNVELVQDLAERHGVDEADILRAFAELERVGVLVKEG